MARKRFNQWLDQIYSTDNNEISCDQLQTLLAVYVELDIDGADVAKRFPQVKGHLARCHDCSEEYLALREILKAEMEGRLPDVEESLAQVEENYIQESAD